MRSKNILLIKPFVLALIILLILIIPTINVSTNIIEPIQHNNDSQILSLNQIGFTQPDFYVNSIIVRGNSLPEDGELVQLDFEIVNNDNVSYEGFDLSLDIEESINLQHGPEPKIERYNASLGVISAVSSTIQSISFIGHFGQYTLTAGIMANGTILPNSVMTVTIQVISQPIGKLSILIVSIIGILCILFLLIIIPSTIERLKSKSAIS